MCNDEGINSTLLVIDGKINNDLFFLIHFLTAASDQKVRLLTYFCICTVAL
jgi:hypothetical protein